MKKIYFEKTVKADRNKVFQIVTDYESLQDLMPQYFSSINVRSTRGNVSVIEQHVQLGGKELVMMTKHVKKEPELHDVYVIGGDAKGSHISEKYEQIPKGTKITVEADIKLKGIMKVIGIFGKNKIEETLVEIMDEFAKIAEH